MEKSLGKAMEDSKTRNMSTRACFIWTCFQCPYKRRGSGVVVAGCWVGGG